MLLAGKKAVIFGVANERSIAYGVAKAFRAHGADIALSWAGEALKKRVEPIAEELGAAYTFPCDVTKDEEIAASAALAKEKFGQVDILVHSVAFANRDDLAGRFVDTSRAGFALALDVSAYSLVALSKAFEPVMSPDSSIMAMTYHGSTKVVTSYNVMGVAKAALEASVMYLAADLGPKGIRVNAISPGPIKTLASSGISGVKSLFSIVQERAPMRRNVTPDDVGGVAVFLGSSLANGVTGETVYVDSGFNILGV